MTAWKTAFGAVTLVLVWAIVTFGNQFLETVELIQKRDWENPQWTVNHSEIEFLQFLNAAFKAQADDTPDLDAVRLSFDIFYSRVETLRNGRLADSLRDLPGFAVELNRITQFVGSAAAIIDQPDEDLRAALPDLVRQAEAFRSTLRRLHTFTLDNWAKESVARREASIRIMIQLAAALAAGFVLLLALVVGLWRVYRENLRRQAALAEAHDRARATEARLREAQTIAKLGSWEVNADGHLYWSDETHRIFDVSPGDFDGTTESFYKRCHPDDIPRIKSAARQAWDTASDYEVSHRIVLPSGEVRTLIERAKPVLDAKGQTVRLVGTVQDITERTIAEDQLRQSQKMQVVGQLTGGVAHDFNNLLAVILGNLELLRETSDPSGHDDYIQAAIQAAERGAELTRNMLSFARKSRLEPRVIDLNKLVQETKTWSSRILPASINVEVSLLAGLWRVEVDHALAQNALLNLLLNARDAMPNGGKLTVETANLRIDQDYVDLNDEEVEPGRYVMLAVSDTGTGIEAAHLERVFEPFFTTKPTGRGSGLGLSMVLGFMRQSGGTVRVYSEVGVGTTFKLYFKACKEPATEVLAPFKSRTAPSRPGASILLVEDEPAVLDVLSTHLLQAGYAVTTAGSGDAALRIWEASEPFDLLLTDIVMPGTLQGTHLARQLRSRHPRLPVIFLSGYANEAMVHGNGLLPDDIRLMKPVRRVDLIAAVEKALKQAVN
ncbi:ATP-binding protein [Tropicibacter sp. S64]|uniref:PAS domain-containing hybrid sensor histidine kinase/response regulator n=1 Tax=Tropicibacter sp. S64 TaxID=3415122 RepID=UPI003C7BD2C0